MTDKPLSETNPTLQDKFIETKWITNGEEWRKDYEDLLKHVQSCTVDIAEHERLKKELFTAVDNYGKMESEVERLKKELQKLYEVCDNHEKAMHEVNEIALEQGRITGIAEGERRAMQRVKETLLNARKGIADSRKHENREFYKGALSYVEAIEEELGLSEEEKKHE